MGCNIRALLNLPFNVRLRPLHKPFFLYFLSHKNNKNITFYPENEFDKIVSVSDDPYYRQGANKFTRHRGSGSSETIKESMSKRSSDFKVLKWRG